MGDVSARPLRLSDFATNQQRISEELERSSISAFNAFRAFLNAPGGSCANEGIPLMNGSFPNLLHDFHSLGVFVKAVSDAVIAADGASVTGDGVVTVDHVALLNALTAAHIDIASLSEVKAPATISLPIVGTYPPSSGYVSDPVCTATGFLVSRSLDFALPPRLALLAGERTYASGSTYRGAFGRGWCSWFDVRLERDADRITLITNDGRHVNLNDVDRCLAVGLTARQHDAGTTVTWNAGATVGAQVWEFETSGRLLTVTGELIGRTTFVRNRTGHIVELRHDSGRSVSYRWRKGRVIAATSSDGRTASCGYDGNGDIVELSNAIDPQRFDLDELGRIQRITDADGVVRAEMEYDEESRVICQRSATGVATRFSYAAPYRTTVRDADGDALSVYVHNSSGQVEMAATVDGLRLSQRFDNLGELAAQSYPDGRSFVQQTFRDEQGRVEERVWSTGLLERFEFDHEDRLVRRTTSSEAGESSSTAMTYAADSTLPSHLELPDGSFFDVEWSYGAPSAIRDADGVTVGVTVAADGTVSEVVNGLGHRQTFAHHPSGQISGSTLADGSVVSIDYDDGGRPTRFIAADGGVTSVAYTPAGRLSSVVDPVGSTHTFLYEQRGLAKALIDPLGNQIEFGFDGAERLVHIGLEDGTSIEFDVDVCGRLSGATCDGARWEATRDTAGRLTSMIDPVGRETQYRYSEDGLVSSRTDPTGATWHYVYDSLRRLVTIETADDQQVKLGYTPSGQVARLTDAAGAERIKTFTAAGRVATETDESLQARYTYDAAGQIDALDFGSGSWKFERDSRGRVVSATSPEGRRRLVEYDRVGNVLSSATGYERWSFTYDLNGRVVESLDPANRRVQLGYDLLGRVAIATDPVGSTTRFEYDLRGRPAVMLDSLGREWRFRYDSLNQMTAFDPPYAEALILKHDASGEMLETRYPDVEPTVYWLDAAGRAVRIEDGRDSVRIERSRGGIPVDTAVGDTWTNFGWSADGVLRRVGDMSGFVRPTIETDRDGLVTVVRGESRRVELERDQCGHVVKRTDFAINPNDGRLDTTSVITVERDVAGRITRRSDGAGVHEFGYDAAGRLVHAATASTAGQSDTTSVHSWTYDAFGRLIAEEGPDGKTTYEYGDGQRLMSMVTPTGFTRFEYDERGQRIASYGETNARYEWGAMGLTRAVVNGVDVSAVPSTAGLPISVAGVDISWEIPNSIALAYGPDFDPVEVFVTSQCGPLGATTWGDCRTRSTTPQWHPFHGVAAAGLVWLGRRVYDPATRQFLSPDPAATVVGAPSSAWTYHYASGDPINLIDPWGTEPISTDEFKEIMDRATGVQWGHVVVVAAVVVIAVAAPVAVGALAPVIAGATGVSTVAATTISGAVVYGAAGAGQEMLNQWAEYGCVRSPGAVVKQAFVGSVLGGAGAGLTSAKKFSAIKSFSESSYPAAGLVGATENVVQSLATEGYDKIPVMPGADGKFEFTPASFGADVTTGLAGGMAGRKWEMPEIRGNKSGGTPTFYHTTISPNYKQVIAEEILISVKQAAKRGYSPTQLMLKVDPTLPAFTPGRS